MKKRLDMFVGGAQSVPVPHEWTMFADVRQGPFVTPE